MKQKQVIVRLLLITVIENDASQQFLQNYLGNYSVQNQSLNASLGQSIDRQTTPTLEEFDQKTYMPRLVEAMLTNPQGFAEFKEDLIFRDFDIPGKPALRTELTEEGDLVKLKPGMHRLDTGDQEGLDVFVVSNDSMQQALKQIKSWKNKQKPQ